MTDAETTAREASKEGVFNVLDRVLGRNYPTEVVDIYLDEATGYEILKVEEKLSKAADPDKVAELEAKLAELRETARDSLLRFRLEGVPSEAWDEVVKKTQEEFPLEYRETRHPLTMAVERVPVENDDRDTFFRVHTWALFIRSVEDANGDTDSDITPEVVARLFGLLPITGLLRLQEAVDKLRMTTDWMDQIQGEDFLAKS